MIPVIRALAAEGAVVSVDTMRAEVAAAALAAGATLVNDVSGGLADPASWTSSPTRERRTSPCTGAPTATTCATSRCTTAPGRGRGGPRRAGRPRGRHAGRGIAAERIVLDPGLGFAKRPRHNWELLAGLDRIADLGYPVLVGASRKSFLGELLAGPDGAPRGVDRREAANTAVTVHLARAGVWGVRVHDACQRHDALRVVARLEEKS